MQDRSDIRYRPRRPVSWHNTLTIIVIVAVAAGLFCGYLVYTTARDLVGHSRISLLPSLPQTNVAEAQTQQLSEPAKMERINILLLGIDQREIETGPCRTDTMIVVSIDPVNKSLSMLSIPRDLWVEIPDYNENNRINAAHMIGDARDYPGGGPALAKKTVQYTLGIPIQYYVRVNFEGFVKLVDMIGGITINVDSAIHDEKYPDANYGFMTVDIPAGVQKMDGATALQYARVRHGSSDFYRGRRQRQVLLAIKDKALSLDIPLTDIPGIIRTLGDTMDTDLTLGDMEYLARIGRTLRPESIQSAAIDETMTTSTMTPEGWDVLLADRERIRQLVDQLFLDPSTLAHPTGTPVDLLIEEAAKVDVQNGTLTAGMAERAANYLSKQGYQVVSFSNADRNDYSSTIIIDYTDKPNTVKSLQDLLNVAPENVRHETADVGVDVRVIVGQDYSLRN